MQSGKIREGEGSEVVLGALAMTCASSLPIRTRHVLHVGGFDPLAPEGYARHLSSGLRHFAELWNARATTSPPAVAEDGRTVDFDVHAEGANWTTDTRYTVLRWDEVIMPYVRRAWLLRMARGYAAIWDFARTGTLRRFFETSLRYGLFVIYPLFLLILFAGLSVAAGGLAAGLRVPSPAISAPLIGVAVFFLLFRFLGPLFHLEFALADWAFAADLANGRVDGLEANLDRFTKVVLAAIREPGVDEVVLSGFSLGAVMLVEVLGHGLTSDPELFGGPRPPVLLTVGSSILKIALHPQARSLRRAVIMVAGEPRLDWVEYQSRTDFLNFYRVDPTAVIIEEVGRPAIVHLRMRNMLNPEAYRRMKWSPLRVHRQFVMPNGERYFYDFYQICFGPLPLVERARLGNQAASVFARDGSYLCAETAARAGAAAVA